MPDWLHIPLWLYWWPGVYALILTLIAGIVPTVKIYEHRRVKISYVVVLALLVGLEMAAISHDRYQQNKDLEQDRMMQATRFDQTMQGFTQMQRTIMASSQAQERAARSAHLPEISLKKRAADLSAKIFSFLTDRKVNEPRLTPFGKTKEEMDAQFDALVRYGNQTLSLYEEAFLSKVIAIHDEFARLGMRDSRLELDQFYEHPRNEYAIEVTASEVGALAERLKK
jgi:hypothetical protein